MVLNTGIYNMLNHMMVSQHLQIQGFSSWQLQNLPSWSKKKKKEQVKEQIQFDSKPEIKLESWEIFSFE